MNSTGLYVFFTVYMLALTGCREVPCTTFSLPGIAAKYSIEKTSSEAVDETIAWEKYIPIEAQGQPIKYLAIHCTASPPSSDITAITQLDWWKRTRGWNRWGYHIVVFPCGEIRVLNPAFRLDAVMEPREIVNGVHGINRHTISIAYVGGVNEELDPQDNMTTEQFHAISGFIVATKSVMPNIIIAGHRDFRRMLRQPYKACPSLDVSKKFKEVIGDNILKLD